MSRLTPDHPCYRSPSNVAFIRWLRPSLSRERRIIRNGSTGIIQGRTKRSGPCYYRSEPTYRTDRKTGLLLPTGSKIVRIDRDGERIPRARRAIHGMTGKAFRKRFKRELRLEREAANAA